LFIKQNENFRFRNTNIRHVAKLVKKIRLYNKARRIRKTKKTQIT
jgi:hypothetical protein